MPKRATAKRMTTDEFIAWLTGQLPNGVELEAFAHWSHRRNGSSLHLYYCVSIDITGRSPEYTHFKKDSHDLGELARWFLEVALPGVQPAPPPRPVRKMTVDRPKLTHQPTEPLFR